MGQLALILIAAAPALVAAGADATAENLLPDASFDVAGLPPVGWASRAWQGTDGNARWEVLATGRTGRCLSIRSTEGADAAWTATVPVEPGTFYRLSGWIRTRNVRGARGALLNIQGLPNAWTPAVIGTSDWRHVSAVIRTGAEMTSAEVNCLFGGLGLSTGQAWYDDIVFEEIRMSESRSATVTVDTSAPSTSRDPMIFGGFLEQFGRQIYGGVYAPDSPLSDEDGFRVDAIEALRELRVPVIRWPGGCYASGYHWRAGVGAQRRITDDMAWGVREPNTFGTDEFVQLCRKLDCTPYICNNAGNGTIDEMREWVEYCNAEDRGPDRVPIWSIGNENWGAHEIGNKAPEEWAPLVREAAEAMRVADPSVQLTAAATPSPEWTLPLLEAAGEYLDYISIHNYWTPNWAEIQRPTYLESIVESDGLEALIESTIAVLDESGYRGKIRIAFDEWNLRSWHHPGFPRKTVQDYDDPEVARLVEARDLSLEPSIYTMADALFSASFLNACLRHADDVGMANIAPIVNTTGPLYVHPEGIVRRTTFHVLAMYANLLGDRVAPTEVEAGVLVSGDRLVPVVDAIATRSGETGAWSVALVNRHPSEPVECALCLGETPVEGRYNATVLAGDSPDAYNDINHPDRVAPEETMLEFTDRRAELPPHSLVILRVAPESRVRRC